MRKSCRLLPPALLPRSMLRPLANDQRTFFRKMSLPPILGSCAVVAFCQCLVYQVGSAARCRS